jgi:transcriptional antiterminator RfaH
MHWMNDLNWFAIQTKPHQERLAAAYVATLDIEVFLPRIRQELNVCGSLRTVSKALFPGYFFAHFCPSYSQDAVRNAPGVVRVLGTGPFPLPVAPGIIAEIRERAGLDGFLRLSPRSFLPGDQVAIEQGPFAGWMGRVEREWNDGRRVMILMEAIQQARVLIEKRWLTVTTGAT